MVGFSIAKAIKIQPIKLGNKIRLSFKVYVHSIDWGNTSVEFNQGCNI